MIAQPYIHIDFAQYQLYGQGPDDGFVLYVNSHYERDDIYLGIRDMISDIKIPVTSVSVSRLGMVATEPEHIADIEVAVYVPNLSEHHSLWKYEFVAIPIVERDENMFYFDGLNLLVYSMYLSKKVIAYPLNEV